VLAAPGRPGQCWSSGGELREQRYAAEGQRKRIVVLAAVLSELAHLGVGNCHVWLVADFFADSQGFAVPAAGLVLLPSGLGDRAEFVVVASGTESVAEFFANTQGCAVSERLRGVVNYSHGDYG
jgi:hypothetical protein